MSARKLSPAVRRRAALAVLLALVTGCEGDSATSPNQTYRADVSLAITMQAVQGGGEATAFDKANAVHIRLGPEAGAALLEETAPFDPQGETHIPIGVLIKGETQALLQVTLLRDTDSLFNGSTSLTLVPNDVAAAALTLVPIAAGISVPQSLPPLDSLGQAQPLSGTVLFATGDVADSLQLTWTSLTPSVVAVRSDSVVAVGPGQGQLLASYAAFADTVQVPVTLPPVVITDSVTNLSVSLATLTAHVNPNMIPTTAWFEWGTDSALSSPSQTSQINVGSGPTAQQISQPLTGLSASTTYYFRAVASNAGGTQAGSVVSFTTLRPVPPAVTALAPASVGATTATGAGTVNPLGTATSAWFEWGVDSTFTRYQSTPSQNMGAGTSAVSIQQLITGLAPDGGAIYYYRVAAQNAAPGTSRSNIVSFTTTPTAPSGLSGSFDGPLYLYWTDNSSSETYFQVERSTSSTGGFSVTGTSPANSPSYSEGGPFPGNPMYYRVRACSAAGCSAPSNVFAVTPPAPSISGYLYLCYSSGTSNCTYFGADTVTLSGPVSATSVSDTYGYYYFSSLPQGTYTVSVADRACYATFRVNQQSVTFGWGAVEMDFYADTILCDAPAPAPAVTSGLSPAVARVLESDPLRSRRRRPPDR